MKKRRYDSGNCIVSECSGAVHRSGRCHEHYKEYTREYLRQMRKDSPEMFKGYSLQRDYGISLGEYEFLLMVQKNACAICGSLDGAERGNNNGSKRLSVDHAHDTGIVRGLLCGNCNKGIGSLLDSPELLKKAAEYLETTAERLEKISALKAALIEALSKE